MAHIPTHSSWRTSWSATLRALVKHLDRIGDSEIAEVNLPTGVPLLYELDGQMRPLRAIDPCSGVSGTFLDSDAAAASIAAVHDQGLMSSPTG